jgi:hypothetical protein
VKYSRGPDGGPLERAPRCGIRNNKLAGVYVLSVGSSLGHEWETVEVHLILYFGPEILEVLQESLRPQRGDIPRVKAYEETSLSVLSVECGRDHSQADVEHVSLVSVCMSSFAELRHPGTAPTVCA